MTQNKLPHTMDIVITGLGVVSPNGIGKDAFWKALHSGHTGIKRIQRFDPSPFPTQIAGEVADFTPDPFMEPKESKRADRSVQFIIASTQMALQDSCINLKKVDSSRVGVLAGTSVGGQGWALDQFYTFMQHGYRKMNPFTTAATFPNASSAQISLKFGLRGPSDTISSGCASSSSAICFATELIRTGKADIMIVGGTESLLYPPIFAAYCASRIMSKRNNLPIQAPSPFDKNRDGIVLGEGSAVLILENLEHAKKRSAPIYAKISGWGSSCGTTEKHHDDSGKTPSATALAMKLALENSMLSPNNISYIKAHGSGQVDVDLMETMAIKDVFGEYAYKIPISSIKSSIGHTVGASGAIETVAATLAMNYNEAPPTLNLHTPDPQCDLDYVPNQARGVPMTSALVNIIGFGGKNVSIVLTKYTNH